MVDPLGRLGQVLALAGDGVDEHRAVVVRAAEEPDGLFLLGADPVGRAVLVDLKDRLLEHEGRILEAEVAVEVAGEVLGGGVLHALVKADDVHALIDHVDDEVGGKTGGAVVEPLDDVAVAQRGDAHGAAVVVDLGVVLRDLELGDHVGKLAKLAVAELLGAVLIEHGNAVVGDLGDLGGEVAGLDGEELLVAARAEHDPRGHAADDGKREQSGGEKERDGALLLHEAEVALGPLALKAGGQQGAAAVDCAEKQDEAVELLGVEVDGGQLEVEVDRADEEGDEAIDGNALAGGADGLARLALALGRGASLAAAGSAVRAGEIKAEAAGVGAGKFDAHKFFLSFCTKPCNKMRLFHVIISRREAKTSGTAICYGIVQIFRRRGLRPLRPRCGSRRWRSGGRRRSRAR